MIFKNFNLIKTNNIQTCQAVLYIKTCINYCYSYSFITYILILYIMDNAIFILLVWIIFCLIVMIYLLNKRNNNLIEQRFNYIYKVNDLNSIIQKRNNRINVLNQRCVRKDRRIKNLLKK